MRFRSVRSWYGGPIVAALLVASAGLPAVRCRADEPPQRIEDFRAPDYHGQQRSLAQLLEGKRLLVFAFLGTECPLAKQYCPRLVKLAEEFESQRVGFVGINSNRQDSLTEIAQHARQSGITFPVLKDNDQSVAKLFGAERTPEVFVVDEKHQIRYAGRIDDQYGVGYQRPEPSRRDLAEALNQILAGNEVTVPRTKPTGCLIGRATRTKTDGTVSYSNQIARIFQNRCESCHREGELAPFALNDYAAAVGWADMIGEVVREGRMPPWSANPEFGVFVNDCRLSDAERQTIETWIADGCPEGDKSELPTPISYTAGWQIPDPDQVIYMDDDAYAVPAEGVVDYQYFTADPGFDEDKWVWAAEARPGNRGVVHHIIVFIEPPQSDESPLGFRQRGGLSGYAPGMPPFLEKAGNAIFVPAHSKLVFQMHYTPNGEAQTDRSYVGIKFAKAGDVKHRVHGGLAPNWQLAIPPGDANYEVTSQYKVLKDALLLSMTPHMHLRGKSFRYEAIYPDAQREVLLDVPKYDFNWQLRYELAEPKLLPKGTKIFCTAHFDNSAENPANPDPAQKVAWGDQTFEEMMIGWFSFIYPAEGAPTSGGGD